MADCEGRDDDAGLVVMALPLRNDRPVTCDDLVGLPPRIAPFDAVEFDVARFWN